MTRYESLKAKFEDKELTKTELTAFYKSVKRLTKCLDWEKILQVDGKTRFTVYEGIKYATERFTFFAQE